ncbi:MAG: hypothetical protein QWI73_05835 [Alphaproteobacteria bacterium]|nr:hypothetical protein [Alphaproteobacteria bacterium]
MAPVTYKRDENEAELLFSQDIGDKLKELNSKYKFKKPVMEVKLDAINGRAFFIREKPLKIEQLSFVRYMYLYAAHLANSSKGKINKFYGHIIVFTLRISKALRGR